MHQADILKLFSGTKSSKEAVRLLSQQNVTEQLNHIGKKRVEVFNSMLSQLQTEKEFQGVMEFCIEEIMEVDKNLFIPNDDESPDLINAPSGD